MDNKPHAELPPLERTREYKDAATQWAEEFDWSDTDWEYVAEEQHANFICRTMQLLAALQSIAALTARAEKAERERDDMKMEFEGFMAYLQDRINETGRNANPFFREVDVDDCAPVKKLSTWASAIYAIQDATRSTYIRRAEAAEAELSAVHKRLDAISEEDRMTRNANS